MGFFGKIFGGLKKTKDAFTSKLKGLFVGELDDDFYEELEYVLLSSDMGSEATERLIEEVKKQAKHEKVKTEEEFYKLLKSAMLNMLTFEKDEETFPELITFVGVNGVGKTTSIGRIAHYYKNNKKSVLFVAGDTFRAAASDQLTEWANRNKVRIVKHAEGADAAAVVFDGISSAKAKKTDVLVIDTAGRHQTKVNLMEELRKIDKVIAREYPEASRYNLIVLDATTGQNALSQIEHFNEYMHIDGIILTKLDGTAKGGVVLTIAQKLRVPVVFIGTGEGIDDLEKFDANEFVDNLF